MKRGFLIGTIEPFHFHKKIGGKGREKMKNRNVSKMVTVAMLGSISYLLMMLDFPFPGLPVFLRIDFSDVPGLVAAILFGPGAMMIVEATKNILYYVVQGSFMGVPVGEVANFIAGCVFILPAAYFYRKYYSVKGLTTGLVVGTTIMTIGMSILNYYLILPAYTWFLNSPAMSSSAMKQLIITGILPFNIIKGVLVAVVSVLLVSRLQVWMATKIKSA